MTWRDKIKVRVPYKIIGILQYLNSTHKDVEFSIFVKIENIDKDKREIMLSDEYFLPEQEVTSASIDIKEFPQNPREWCNIHKHPNGISRFSSIDDESSDNFPLMLLYHNGEIMDEIYLKVDTFAGEFSINTDAEITIFYDFKVPDTSKIKRRTVTYTYKEEGRVANTPANTLTNTTKKNLKWFEIDGDPFEQVKRYKKNVLDSNGGDL